ncbi:MAG TPA: HAMP domain-containing sensor histidine kinase [Propionicimonas sp.]|nr:HAMP domain-containing sensor histidine kinase [Propionicimonas sp.]
MTLPLPVKTAPPSPMGKGTLSRQLVVRTTALVALVTVVLSLFTALASFQILQNQLDDRLQSAVSRPNDRVAGSGDTPGGSDPGGSGLIRIDTLSGRSLIYAKPDDLNEQGIAILLALPTLRGPVTVALPGLGLYRVLVQEREVRELTVTTVVALPYREVSRPMASLLIMAGLLTLGAILLSFIGARRVVERSLRPLTRLAATATQVSNLPLDSGEGHVPIRVAPGDANPASEVGQVGQAFNHMLDNVEGALAARHRSETKVRRFVADASHELRNPLASIRGYAELTRRGAEELPADAAHALGRIEAESERMSALVQDLLLLARLDSEPTLDLKPTDLTEIVLNAVSDARAADSDHTWSLNLPEEVVMGKADAHRLHQVVANLLANARTHTPAGTKVETALGTRDGWAVISVTDNGPGVPTEIQDSVFERFTRADASRVRQAGGSSTGLGLAIVAAVVNAHGGQVDLDSRPGHTRFTIRVPLAA